MADPARFYGRAPEQVDEYLTAVIEPILARASSAADHDGEEPRV